MTSYIPFMIWMLSAGMCAWIARVRQIDVGFFGRMAAVILGPLAIPLMFLPKPRRSSSAA